jgi:hypothetical protein
MPMPRQEAEDLIEPHKESLGGVIRTAWGALARYRDDLAVISRGSRAFLVRDFMVVNALREFYAVPGVAPVFRRGRFFLVFGGVLFVQLKKFNKRGRPSNYLTPQALGIINQAQGDLFEDYPRVTFATAGYKLNALETQIDEVAVACHKGQSELWALEIPERPADAPRASVISLTPPPPPLSRVVHREQGSREQARTDGATS